MHKTMVLSYDTLYKDLFKEANNMDIIKEHNKTNIRFKDEYIS